MPFKVGPTELIIILVVVMIIFGIGKLPQVGGALGKAIREFRQAQSGEETEPLNLPSSGPDNPGNQT